MKIILKKCSLACVFALFIGTAISYAQQSPQYTQYMYNTMSINPAYAGSLETIDIVGTYRNQWVGVDRSPQTQNLGIHSPLGFSNLGVGLNINNTILGPANEFMADANVSYTIRLSGDTRLAFGVKGGFKMLNVDFSRGSFQDPGDPLLTMNIDNKVSPTVGAGAYLYTEKWYLGLSVPDFITSDFYDSDENSVAQKEIQYYLMGGYVFELSSELKFKPAFLLRYLHGFPIIGDVSGNFLIRDALTLGLSYRFDDAISALAGFQISESFFAGYSYDYTTSPFNSYNNGTHEIILRFTMPQKSQRINSPRFF